MTSKKLSAKRMRGHVGRCIECGTAIPMTDLWCDSHRKAGAWIVNGKTMPWTHEESEKNYGFRIRDLVNAGKI